MLGRDELKSSCSVGFLACCTCAVFNPAHPALSGISATAELLITMAITKADNARTKPKRFNTYLLLAFLLGVPPAAQSAEQNMSYPCNDLRNSSSEARGGRLPCAEPESKGKIPL